MSSKSAATVSNKFVIWGVALIALAIAFVALAIMINDLGIIGQVALPVALLGAAMFYRDHLDRKPKR